MDSYHSLVKGALQGELNSRMRLNRSRMEKLTVVDPTPFYLQAGQDVALSPYVPRLQALKGSFLDTSHSYACKSTRDKRTIIK